MLPHAPFCYHDQEQQLPKKKGNPTFREHACGIGIGAMSLAVFLLCCRVEHKLSKPLPVTMQVRGHWVSDTALRYAIIMEYRSPER